MPTSTAAALAERLLENVGKVVLGKAAAIELAAVTLIADGHLLIEDSPGVGKTLLARALARSLDLPFQRIQCTADLLPADILGAHIYKPDTGEIEFRPGPVFTSVLVADELNRTPPRTQSALLQCMQERRVTIERTTRELDDPFFVVATQNPQTFGGTYPLPESQLDRFTMRIRLGYPSPEDEANILERAVGHHDVDRLPVVATADDVRRARVAARDVRVDASLRTAMVQLAQRTRSHGEVRLGVSPRGTQALHRTCQARALLRGRDYVTPDDVHTLLMPVFAHRIVSSAGIGAGDAVMHEISSQVALPD